MTIYERSDGTYIKSVNTVPLSHRDLHMALHLLSIFLLHD